MDDEGHKFDQDGQENQNENQSNPGNGQEIKRIEVHHDGQDEPKSLDGMIHESEPTEGNSERSEGESSEQTEPGSDGGNDESGQGYTTLPNGGLGSEPSIDGASADAKSGPQVSNPFNGSLEAAEPAAVSVQSPVAADKPNGSGRSSTVWIILTVLLFLVAAGVGMMYYLQHQDNQAEVDNLNSKVSNLQSQLSSNVSQPAAAAPSTDGQDYRYIPELAAKYKVSDANKNLTYSFAAFKDSSSVSAGFSSTDLVVKSLSVLKTGQPNPCESGNGPLGMITRYALSDGDTTVLGGEKVKDIANKVGNFYYTYTSPQSSCSGDKDVSSLQQSSQPLVKSVFDNLEAM